MCSVVPAEIVKCLNHIAVGIIPKPACSNRVIGPVHAQDRRWAGALRHRLVQPVAEAVEGPAQAPLRPSRAGRDQPLQFAVRIVYFLARQSLVHLCNLAVVLRGRVRVVERVLAADDLRQLMAAVVFACFGDVIVGIRRVFIGPTQDVEAGHLARFVGCRVLGGAGEA